MKLNKLKFYAGTSATAAPKEIDLPTVTILVGPNNSGKSRALREIENWCWGHDEARKVVDAIDLELPTSFETALSELEQFKTRPPENQIEATDQIWVGLPSFRTSEQVLHQQISLEHLRRFIAGQNAKQEKWLRGNFTRFFTIRLDGRTRFTLSDPKPSGDLHAHPRNHLWALFVNDLAREKVRQFTEDAFGLHFVIDPTAMTEFRVRLSERKAEGGAEEQSLDDRSRKFHGAAKLVSELSDGVQAFTGLVSAVMSLPHKFILIDEPEAFLHPPLARRLGRNLSSVATEREASLIVATHSSEFLMGCLEGTLSIRLIRLTYESGNATARSISPDDLKTLMTDPLLRSAQALRGLFHKYVIVTEADKDRAFYEDINQRLQHDERGIDDALFLNAQNWQTVSRIVGPLRKLGVPVAAIVDLDAITNADKWPEMLAALEIPSAQRLGFEDQRSNCADLLHQAGKAPDGRPQFKVKGLQALPEKEMFVVKNFVTAMAEYGLFIVTAGEVENWLEGIGVAKDPKRTWLIRALNALGSDPNGYAYVISGPGGVWEFIEEINGWLINSFRKGIPD